MTALTVQNQAIQSLTIANSNKVDSIARELMKLHPNSRQIGEQTMMIVAQLAVMSGANPLPKAGELWVWVDWKGNPVIDFGIAFYRRMARQVDVLSWCWDTNDNGDLYPFKPRAMTEQERKDNGVMDGDVAGICQGYRQSEFFSYLKAGVSQDIAMMTCSQGGIGIVSRSEMFARKDTRTKKKGDPIAPPNGRTWQWVANKRAEKDLIRALSLVNPNILSMVQNANDTILPAIDDGQNIKVLPATNTTHDTSVLNGDFVEEEPQNNIDELSQHEQLAYDGQFTNALIDAGIFKNNGEIHQALIGTGFDNGLGDIPTDKSAESCKMRLEIFRRWNN